MYSFEYDNQKSNSNLKKHDIDFVTAQQLWNDPDIIEVQAKSKNEPRFLIVARTAKKHWSAVVTYRGNVIRIISVRHSRKLEVELYES